MSKKQLRRYTDLPSLLYMLRNKSLTLLDPSYWDDKNDSYYLEVYKKRKNLTSVYALCFSEKNETYHHWSVFCSRENGVCIVFDRNKLINHLNQHKGIACAPVEYRTIPGMARSNLIIDDLPFVKRWAFKDESEFRIIYSGKTESDETKDVPIPLSCIRKITINPWAPTQLFQAIKETIKDIDGCMRLGVGKSALINNKDWKMFGNIVA